jgi:hypothetical protein
MSISNLVYAPAIFRYTRQDDLEEIEEGRNFLERRLRRREKELEALRQKTTGKRAIDSLARTRVKSNPASSVYALVCYSGAPGDSPVLRFFPGDGMRSQMGDPQGTVEGAGPRDNGRRSPRRVRRIRRDHSGMQRRSRSGGGLGYRCLRTEGRSRSRFSPRSTFIIVRICRCTVGVFSGD